ncbi:MAG TPA: FecR family protein [Steroidobacteraceae bacterium]|jgi:transmembrane sensor
MKVRSTSSKTNSVIVSEASAWFIEFRAGDVTGEARTQFIDWLRRSPEHIQAYLEVSRVWAELPASDSAGRFDIATLIEEARRSADVISLNDAAPAWPPPAYYSPPAGKRWWERRVELATAAMLLVALAGIWMWGGSLSSDAYATGVGEQRTIQLADGSTVELNSQSKVRVRLSEHRRDVTLVEGQALFRVAKDKSRPFIVRAGGTQVRAVGTEFDVYRKLSGTVVTVVEGKVETFEDDGRPGEPAILLSAGEQLTVGPHTATRPMRTDTAVATAWLQKHMVFEETPLADVAEQFNRYSRLPLIIDGSELQRIKISGVYSSTDPASLINFLRSQPGILVIESDKGVRITRRDIN